MLGKRPRPLLQSSLFFRDKCATQIANAQVSGKHPYPPSSVSHHIVLGFDTEQEIKPFDVCESPRSVLDANAPPLEKQATTRSLRSWLRTLPLRDKVSQGVGLAVIVDIQAEDEEGSCPLPRAGQHAVSPCAWGPRSQPIAIVANSSVRSQLSAKKASKYADLPPIDCQSEVVELEDSLNLDYFGSDEPSPWQECVLHNQSHEAEVDEHCIIPPPIFSVAPVSSICRSFDIQSVSFLDACAFCQHAFLPGKDIYMYRGDQAFCSVECRSKQIKIDESKETCVMASPPNHHGLVGYMHSVSHKVGNM